MIRINLPSNDLNKQLYGEILFDGQVVKRVLLSYDSTFFVNQHPAVVFEVSSGLIGFKISDCHNQICVNTGFIGRVGQVAVCLPNRLVLAVVGEGDMDIIIGG